MKFRDWTKEYDKPYHNDKQWMYDKTPIYDNILDCFLETQRPEGDKSTREKYGNTRLRDPFRKINKYKIQQYLGHMEKNMYKEVDWVEDDTGKIVAIIHYYDLNKMSTKEKKVKSFCGQEYILDKERGDVYIKEMACYPGYEEWLEKLVEKHIAKPKESNKFFDTEEPITIVEIDNQLKRNKDILKNLGFECIDNIVTSFADVYGIWVKGGENLERPDKAQELSLQRLDCDTQDTKELMEQILKLNIDDFANHYSNYNKGNTWKGMVVRGYGGLVDFIVKPAEMVNSWKKENKEKMDWKVKDTPLRKQLPAVEKFADILGDYEHERIRILMLKEGEGELERHTDRQDVEAGIGDGQWARLHFPLQTNPKVEFKQWNADGTSTKCKMGEGELWYLDMRKPHTAVNFGEQDRYHLIIDVKSDQRLRDWLVRSSEKYPSTKQVDDYIE